MDALERDGADFDAPDTAWRPPGKDCGLCGFRNCKEFAALLDAGERIPGDCIFYRPRKSGPPQRAEEGRAQGALTPGAPAQDVLAQDLTDVRGNPWDFVLDPLPGEPSARKIVLPFRADLVEKWGIGRGDVIVGRPFGAGCPVQHVLQVIKADVVTGVLDTWCVGPAFARGRSVKDVGAYHMLGFEGLATRQRRTPTFGARHTFLPGFCMMHLNHTGLVNMVLQKSAGLRVRLEDIRILAGPGE